MLSSINLATTTGLPTALQAAAMAFCALFTLVSRISTEITAGHHDTVALVQHLVKSLQTIDALDLGDVKQRLLVVKSKLGYGVGHAALNIKHFFGALHKGHGDERHFRQMHHFVLVFLESFWLFFLCVQFGYTCCFSHNLMGHMEPYLVLVDTPENSNQIFYGQVQYARCHFLHFKICLFDQ